MTNKNKLYDDPTCIGTGLVVLDVIYADQKKPKFLAGGSCGNVLTILSYLGWNSYPVSRLGRDHEGNRILEDMKRWGVKTTFVHQEQMNSPRIIQKITLNNDPKHKFHIKCEHGKWLPGRKPFLVRSLKEIKSKLPASNVFYFDRADPSALDLAKMFKKMGAMIYFEPPKFLHDDLFLECLKISDVVKHCYDQSSDVEKYGVKIPLEIRTRGKAGLQYRARFLRKHYWKSIPAYPTSDLVDEAGSGDWLSAGFIHATAQHKENTIQNSQKLESALRFGQAMASLNCSYTGARGIMYNLPSYKLLMLVNKVIQEKPVMLPHGTVKTTSRHTSRCKVCLCTE